MFSCPVCFYDQLPYEPADYNICVCCGTEFGVDDEVRSHQELRESWISRGAKWFFGVPAPFWSPWEQLAKARVPLPFSTTFRLVAPTVVFNTVANGIGNSFPYSSPDTNDSVWYAKAA